MTESEWLTSDNFSAMMEYLTHQTLPTYSAYGAQTGAVRQELVEPLISQRKLQLLDDACFALFGLNLDDVICQSKPVVGAAALLRSLAGNVFAPLTLPAGEPQRCKCATRSNAIWECVGCPDCHGKGVVDGPCPWLTSQVVSLATAAYEDRERQCPECLIRFKQAADAIKLVSDDLAQRLVASTATCRLCQGTNRVNDGTLDPDRLAVLSDAAEEAGCDDERVLMPLRGWVRCSCDGKLIRGVDDDCHVGTVTRCLQCDHGWIRRTIPFVRGFWPLDLFLGYS